MANSEKPAAWLTDGCRVDFWREINPVDSDVAERAPSVVAANEDTATYVDVSAGPMTTCIRLEWPRDRAIVQHFQYLCEKAFVRGQYRAKQELKQWLLGGTLS